MAISHKASLFCSFVSGVVLALVITAGTFVWISGAPIPLVNKVQQVSTSVDPALLDGKSLDPNKPLYGESARIDDDSRAVATVATDNSAQSAQGRFWVHAGAFNQAADAEGMRARVAFIGLDAQITHRNENGQRLYRVRIGPFDTPEQAEDIRQSLADNGIQGTVLQQRQ